MTTLMEGQLDALALLADDPLAASPKFKGFPRPTEPVIPDFPLTCPGCGQTETNVHIAKQNHWIHPADSHEFGRPVCIRMNLTRNHVIFWSRVLSGDYVPPDKKCCHGAIKAHKGKTTRQFYIDHLRLDIDKAIEAWDDMTWLTPLMESAGVTLDELDENEWGASCDRKGCHWVTRWSGYATRSEAMDALGEHIDATHGKGH